MKGIRKNEDLSGPQLAGLFNQLARTVQRSGQIRLNSREAGILLKLSEAAIHHELQGQASAAEPAPSEAAGELVVIRSSIRELQSVVQGWIDDKASRPSPVAGLVEIVGQLGKLLVGGEV